jgi:hypothetical protein
VCQLEARAQDPKLSTVIVWARALGLRLRWIEATQGNFG